MKTPFFAFAAILSLVLPQPTHAQELDQQQQLEELQANIEILKAEIEYLRENQNQQSSYELTPVPPPPENRYQQERHSILRPTPFRDPYEDRFNRDFVRGDGGPFDERSFDRTFHGDREFVPVFVPQPVAVPQPVPVLPQPGCSRTYGAGGIYIGPGGWGFDVRGIQFNFGF